MACLFSLCVLLSVASSVVFGHGRLMDPPSRNSMWKVGFQNPANYNDNELNCGGFAHQWSVSGGMCGVCGDPYGKEQAHVFPGRYANNIITRTYSKGQEIEVKVHISAHHKGYFTFEIGDIGHAPITDEKLHHLLRVAGSKSTRYYLPKGSGTGFFKVSLQLPRNLLCRHCVLRWTYRAGNSWGIDETGNGIGKGAQETFVNCADVSIEESDYLRTTVTSHTKASAGTKRTPLPVTQITRAPSSEKTVKTTKKTTIKTNRQTSTTEKMGTSPQRSIHVQTTPLGQKCRATASYASVPGMDAWCNSNCPQFCPKSHCICSAKTVKIKRCRGAGAYAHVPGMDSWCTRNCPAFCPKSHCICVG